MKKKVYISGPISGLSREEYVARFLYAEYLLRADGYDVVNPTRLAPCRWPWIYYIIGYRLTLAYDLHFLRKCDYILCLPGWTCSRGASVEFRTAHGRHIQPVPRSEEYYQKVIKYIKSWPKKYRHTSQN